MVVVRAIGIIALALAAACDPAPRPADDNTAPDAGVAIAATPDANANHVGSGNGSNFSDENTPTACADGADNDGDGLIDCADPDCSGVGACPVCGAVDHPLSSPLALPDGVCGTNGNGDCGCVTDADCTGISPAGQHCFIIPGVGGQCRSSYIAKLAYSSFAPNQRFAAGNLQSVCVTMEHSWLRDLQIELIAPSGERVRLQRMLGQIGGEIYLGDANDCDTSNAPVPGTGATYCWSPTATNPSMLAYADNAGLMVSVVNCYGGGAISAELPPDTYAAADPWSNLDGATLNGNWELRVTDLWENDNGYVFEWSLAWDQASLSSCAGPVIL
jgi:hypothetical protein